MSHGGKRQGAGRPPRKDGRKLRLVKVALNDAEAEQVLAMSTDKRREKLIAKVLDGHIAPEQLERGRVRLENEIRRLCNVLA